MSNEQYHKVIEIMLSVDKEKSKEIRELRTKIIDLEIQLENLDRENSRLMEEVNER